MHTSNLLKSAALALGLIVSSVFAADLSAKVRLHSLIGDNMVLQQQTAVNLWGKADAGAKIKVHPSWDKVRICHADAQGNWKISVPTPAASYEPQEILFDDGEKTVIKNVLIGEVWFAAGQSNMEMPLQGFNSCPVMDGNEEIYESCNYPHIRMFKIPRKHSLQPETECGGQWDVASMAGSPTFSACGWFFAKYLSTALDVPVGIINCSSGGSSMESWTNYEINSTYPDIAAQLPNLKVSDRWFSPLMSYNAMLYPAKNFTIKGFIWYQGCSNTNRYDSFTERFSNMIALWRKDWNSGELPFYYVEIAPFEYGDGVPLKAAYLREEQFKAQYVIPNTAMVSINDLVLPDERYNIHPADKKHIGMRLCNLALARTYGMKNIFTSGPVYKSWERKGHDAWVTLDCSQCINLGRNFNIQGFELAGEDRIFYPADKVRTEGRKIILSSEKVEEPAAVRYCFKNFQLGNMVGMNGLPLVPFRTDDWK